GVGPVDPAVGIERLAPALELFDELRVDREPIGHAQQLLAEVVQPRRGHGRLHFGAWRAAQFVVAGRVLVVLGRLDVRLQALVHACTSSALTCTIGTSKPLARSDAQRVERASSGSVVKPTWLLVMMCTVPPTL